MWADRGQTRLSVFLISGLSLCVTTLGLLGVVAQAKVVASFGSDGSVVLAWLGVFLSSRLLATWVSGTRDAVRKLHAVRALRACWSQVMPHLYLRRLHHEDHRLSSLLLDRVPQWAEVKLNEIQGICFSAIVFAFFIYQAFNQRLYWALLWLGVLTVFIFTGARVYRREYMLSAQASQDSRLSAGSWFKFFLGSSNELWWNSSWQKTPEQYSQWTERVGDQIVLPLKRHAWLFWKREIWGSVFADWPYIFGMSGILYLGILGRISLAQAVLWFALTDYLIQAVQAMRSALGLRVRRISLETSIRSDLEFFSAGVVRGQMAPWTNIVPVSFVLRDGSTATIGSAPGIYEISGKNGSGKSTLIQSLMGLRDDAEGWSVQALEQMKRLLFGRTRVIDREAQLVPGQSGFLSNLYPGVEGWGVEYGRQLKSRLSSVLPDKIIDSWNGAFSDLARKWAERGSASPSSGERVLLSWSRAFLSWDDEVRFLVLDEPESFLDRDLQSLVDETLRSLALKIAIFRVRHDRVRSSTLLTTGMLAGVSSGGGGRLVEFEMRAEAGGSGRVTVTNPSHSLLIPVFKNAVAALGHTFPELRPLETFDYLIDFKTTDFKIGEVRSAGLAAALAFINIYRLRLGRQPLLNIAATGEVRLDGSVVLVGGLSEKREAAQIAGLKALLTPFEISHLRDFPRLLGSSSPATSSVVQAV
jgi:ABC-type cobalamin/Fe3+-siderophores transport system ATPase subunit